MIGGKSLEQHSQTEDTQQTRQILEAQLRECFGRVVYSHKTHEKCADLLLAKWANIKLWQLILSALSTAGFISAVAGAEKVGSIAGATIASILLVLNAYTKNYDLGQLAQKHKQTGCDLWFVRERYLSLITDLAMREKPIESLQTERDKVLKDLHAIYAGAPPTNGKAYGQAQVALQQNEELTFSEKEIDAFLPKPLKRSQSPVEGNKVNP